MEILSREEWKFAYEPQPITPIVLSQSPTTEGVMMDNRLMVHAGAKRVTREELLTLPTPSSTNTHKIIAHAEVVNQLEEALSFRHISIVRGEYAIAKDGARLFSLLEVNAEHEGVRFAIALRNAHDKSMTLAMTAGYRVFICDNMAMAGDFKPLAAKHTRNFDLTDALSIGVDRLQRSWEPLREKIDFMREKVLPITTAQALIYRAFTEGKFPVRLLKSVHNNYFNPGYDEFKPRTVWSLSNAFTSAFKEAKPDRHFELTARLGKFLSAVSTPNSQN